MKKEHRSPFQSWLATAMLLGTLALWCPQAWAQAPQQTPPLVVGAAWYPEQWPESAWDRDLQLMEDANIRVVRIGEFAWSAMEPSEGQYQFAWLDHAVSKAAAHHIQVVLGTPTAAPPAWLTQKYPETLRVGDDGVRDEHGNRQQFSFASPRYRQLARGIVTQMATRYGHDPNVIGWQLDNEYAATSFDPDAKAQFHAWLQHRYTSIGALNQRWTTAYWSQTYNSFEQIPVHESGQHPALLLDWKRFVSDTWRDYSVNQIDAIRAHAERRQFITTNTMGWFDGFDAYVLHSVLDMAAWDDYVQGEQYDWLDNAARHDLTRGYKNDNYWVMETQPGFVNWRKTNVALHAGVVRDMAWQAVGHGADAVLYWQWRSALNGQEEYHGTVVGADGSPQPIYAEVAQIGREFAKAGPALAGTLPHADVAVINDFDSRWAIDFQRHAEGFNPLQEMKAFYAPLRKHAQNVDVVSARQSLDGYRLVVAPALNVLPDDLAKHLLDYVRGGGHLVLGPRSGMKNLDNGLNPQRQPGPLTGPLGVRVEQFYALDKEVPVSGRAGSGNAKVWAEQLSVTAADVQTELSYGKSNGWLDGQPAVVSRSIGKGTLTYVGAWLDDGLLESLSQSWLKDADIAPLLPNVPDDVEVTLREGQGRKVWIVINHGEQAHALEMPTAMRDLLDDHSPMRKHLELAPYGVALLQRNNDAP